MSVHEDVPTSTAAEMIRVASRVESRSIEFGRGEKIRTSDPLHPMQVRYQAALRPDRTVIIPFEITRPA